MAAEEGEVEGRALGVGVWGVEGGEGWWGEWGGGGGEWGEWGELGVVVRVRVLGKSC